MLAWSLELSMRQHFGLAMVDRKVLRPGNGIQIKDPSDSKITSSGFVYANDGHQLPDKMDHLTKCPQTETKIDCQIHMNLKMVSEKGISK
jgi:hypothetical protein